MADFGYSTLAAGETGKVFLPKSRPWNAPEHHNEEFTVGDAKKADVYSFGMLCLWILFEDSLPGIPQTTEEGTTEFISFDAPPWFGPRTYLEQLKDDDKVEHVVSEHIESMFGWHTEQRTCLKEIFSFTLQRDPEKRTSDFATLIGCMSQKRQVSLCHIRVVTK